MIANRRINRQRRKLSPVYTRDRFTRKVQFIRIIQKSIQLVDFNLNRGTMSTTSVGLTRVLFFQCFETSFVMRTLENLKFQVQCGRE